jgi:D-glycero-alpha-D-manno-heptose-7-phosphate kinase
VRLTSSAPTRIDLAGGTIDIWPLFLFHPGAVTLNAAISLRAQATVEARTDGRVAIHSTDTGRVTEVAHWSELVKPGEMDLLGRLLHFFQAENLTLTTTAKSPAGAGIAGSSALNVAVCGLMARWKGVTYEPEALLAIAQNIEAQAIQCPTGSQDYRPAMYGGVAAVELGVEGTRRVGLSVNPKELERRIVLAYTGAPRNSGTNNWEMTKRHLDGDQQVIDCFDRIRDTAVRMRTALEREDWPEVGRQIAQEWDNRQRLAPGVTTPQIDGLMAAAGRAGATAGKVCGAGGGGCLFCFSEPEATGRVREALAAGGARILDYHIETEGLIIQ